MFEIPSFDERNILSSDGATATLVVWVRRPPKSDGVLCVVALNLSVAQEWLDRVWKLKVVLFIFHIIWEDSIFVVDHLIARLHGTGRDWVDERIVVECWKIWIFDTNIEVLGLVVGRDVNRSRQTVVQMRERDLVFGSDRLANDDFGNVVELASRSKVDERQ